MDIDEDNMIDNPWDFGTASQYPVLKADVDGDDDATWEEFGYQLRTGPTLTATQTTNAGQRQVELEWTEVSLSSEWTPAPSVSYTVTREDDESIESIAENLTARKFTDTGVAGETYVYQVMAMVDGGEAVRSATVSVTVTGNKRPVAVGRLRSRWLLVGDSAMTEVGGAFEDPEGDAITYQVSSSDTMVARVSISGTLVTITPVAEGPCDHHGDRYRRWLQPEQDPAVHGDGSAHHDGRLRHRRRRPHRNQQSGSARCRPS